MREPLGVEEELLYPRPGEPLIPSAAAALGRAFITTKIFCNNPELVDMHEEDLREWLCNGHELTTKGTEEEDPPRTVARYLQRCGYEVSFVRGALLTGELACFCAMVDAITRIDEVLHGAQGQAQQMRGQNPAVQVADLSWVRMVQRSFALQDLEQVRRLLEALIVPVGVDKDTVMNLNELFKSHIHIVDEVEAEAETLRVLIQMKRETLGVLFEALGVPGGYTRHSRMLQVALYRLFCLDPLVSD